MEIRDASRNDANSIAVLSVAVWIDAYASDGITDVFSQYLVSELTPEKVEAEIANEASRVIVAEQDGHLIGFAVMSSDSRCPCDPAQMIELKTLYVHQRFRRQGVGSRLLQEIETLCRNQGVDRLWLTVWEPNTVAKDFYESSGYKSLGRTHFDLDGRETHENLVLGKTF